MSKKKKFEMPNPPPPRDFLPHNLSEAFPRNGEQMSQLDFWESYLVKGGHELNDWYLAQINKWKASQRAENVEKKTFPSNNGKKIYLSRTWCPIVFSPVTTQGRRDFVLSHKQNPNKKATYIQINKETWCHDRTDLNKYLLNHPELKPIVFALDEACVVLRKLNRFISVMRLYVYYGDRVLGEHYGTMPEFKIKRSRRIDTPVRNGKDKKEIELIDLTKQIPEQPKRQRNMGHTRVAKPRIEDEFVQ